mgnify:FL=1
MATRTKGQRTVRVADCDVLVIVVESGSAPNIVWQFGAPVEQPATPTETMSVEAPAPASKPRRKGKGKANNAPAPAAEKPQSSDKPKGGKRNFGKEKPQPLCTAQRICEYKGKDKTEYKPFAIVGSGVVKKADGKWAQGTRFVQLRYIDEEEGMIVGSTFPCQEGDWAARLRNVRPFNPELDTCCCDLCLNG